jgi:hypothetical protein
MKYSLTLSILATETVFVIVLLMFIYFNYKRISELEKDNDQIKFYQNKNEINDNLSFEVNKNIIDYINSLKIIKGSELDAVQKNVLNEINKLKRLHRKEIKQVSENINQNEEKIKVNKMKINLNKENIDDNLNRIYKLRTAVKYDLDKLLIRFIKEFMKKYDITENNQMLLYKSRLFYSYIDYSPIILLFDNGLDKPDKILFDNSERIFPLLHKLLNNYQIQNYTNDIIFETNYLNINDSISNNYLYHEGFKSWILKVPLYNEIFKIISDDNKDVINWFTNNIPFIFDIYLPRLLNYVDINKVFIFNKIDEMMLNYFSKFPSFKYFNEFFTHITLSDIQNDRNHLLNILKKYIFEDVNKDKENEIINNEHLYKMLIVLLPEMLFMMKYNIDYANKYQKIIVSEYFVNVPTLDSRIDQNFNLVNFVNFVKSFTCKSVAHNGEKVLTSIKEKENYRNIALKLYLSENMSYIETSTRRNFENVFLKKLNDTILYNTQIITRDKVFKYEDFICNPYNKNCVDEETCNEKISIKPITETLDETD